MIRLCRVDDALRDYRVFDGDACIGEIRARVFGTAELHMAEGRWLLRRDDTAEALRQRAGFVRAVLRHAAMRACYTLRDGPSVLARAERRFSLSPRRDGLRLWPAMPPTAAWAFTRPGGLHGPWRIDAGGEVLSRDGGREFIWQGPGLPAPAAVFALYALHQQFGRHPSRGDVGGE